MTTLFIPAPEIFLAGAILTACTMAIIPLLQKAIEKAKAKKAEEAEEETSEEIAA
jgi:hypothetical protein